MLELDRLPELAALVYGKVPPINPTETASQAAARGALEILQLHAHFVQVDLQAAGAGPALVRSPAGAEPSPKSIGVIQEPQPGQAPSSVTFQGFEYRWQGGNLEYRQLDGPADFALAGEELERHYFDVVYLCFRPAGQPRGDTGAMLEAIGSAILDRMLGQLELRDLPSFVQACANWQAAAASGNMVDATLQRSAVADLIKGA
jgi:hypothetical protein